MKAEDVTDEMVAAAYDALHATHSAEDPYGEAIAAAINANRLFKFAEEVMDMLIGLEVHYEKTGKMTDTEMGQITAAIRKFTGEDE